METLCQDPHGECAAERLSPKLHGQGPRAEADAGAAVAGEKLRSHDCRTATAVTP
jgi:hypothetical protein